MNRISLLLALSFLILSFGLANAIGFEAHVQPGKTFTHPEPPYGTYYMANTDLYIAIGMQNTEQIYHTGWTMGLQFYSPDPGVVVNWVDAGASPIASIERINGWQDDPTDLTRYWKSLNLLSSPDWDGTLPDNFVHDCLGEFTSTGGWNINDTEMQDRFRIHLNVPASGSNQTTDVVTICVDEFETDWLFPEFQDFGGPYCFEFAAVPDLGISADFLRFEATADDDLPDQQFVILQNVGEKPSLSWTAQKNTSWLSIIPSSGTLTTNPVTLQIAVLTTSLPPAIYYDTISIISPEAGNSPVKIAVEYEVFGHPPIIELSPTNFIFNAVAGMGNPADQILTISNTGESDLNWTASHAESWLSLAPESGFNGGDVTLSVDITGLAYGIYYDTIVVEDPEAGNNPQKAYVQLEVASDLPIIEIDSTFIFIIANQLFPPARSFNITNAGGGSMNYYLQENSMYIVSMDPASGSVPQEVTVQCKTAGEVGTDSFDTIWVYSDEAINSPQVVVFQCHFTDDPAVIGAMPSSFSAEYVECGQGAFIPMLDGPIPLNVLNISDGGHEPFVFNITHNEDWLLLDQTTGPAPATIPINFEYRGLAPGIYRDTLHISAINAINSPVLIPVTMTITEATEEPLIITSAEMLPSMKFAAQINKYGPNYWFSINNQYPGCLEWEFEHLPPWLAVTPDPETSYPWEMNFRPSGHGMSRGIYYDEIRIVSPDATNSPKIIVAEFDVWEFYGDTNFDGVINILDIIYLIDYRYKNGPPPQPVTIVGDCNCDGVVDVLDIVELIDYIYKDHNPICGNPY